MIDSRILEETKKSTKLYNIYIENNRLYMIRLGDYTDEIEKTKRLQEKNVNFAGPISQMKLEENQIIVEEILAPGTTFEQMESEYKFESNTTSEEILNNYKVFFLKYLEEIKLRAETDQSTYDKLFRDITEMNKENLTVDTCSTGNLFFDSNTGFSIIDAYPGNTIPDIKSLLWLVIGDIPNIICTTNNQKISHGIPSEYYEEFMMYINLIINKFITAAKNNNIEYDYSKLKPDTKEVTINSIDELTKKEKSNLIRIGI